MKITAVSIGNSSVSAARVDGKNVLEKKSAKAGSRDGWPELIEWIFARADIHPPVYASVNPPVEEALLSLSPGPWIKLGRDRPLPIRDLTLSPGRTGHDRLLCGYAASRVYGAPVVVVDFGTALTFNLIDKEGAFRGGAISPGLGLAAASLAKGCAALPFVDRTLEAVPLVGRDTESAIRSGLLNGYLGMVEYMVGKMREELGGTGRAIATGGDAVGFVSRTSVFHALDSDLLLKGIALAFEAAESRRSRS